MLCSAFPGVEWSVAAAVWEIVKSADHNIHVHVVGILTSGNTLCPKSLSARGLVASLPVRLLFKSI